MSENEQPGPSLLDRAIELVLLMSRSMDPEKIPPLKWWLRLKTALYNAASSAENWGRMISLMGQDLEVEVFSLKVSSEISRLREEMTGDRWEAFRELCQQDALFITALAQAEREEQKRSRDEA